MEESNIAIRPMAIIEAKFDLEAKQNDIIDMLLTEIKKDEQVVYYLDIDKYRKIYNTNTSNIYRDMKKAVEGFEKKGVKININGKDTWFAWFSKITYLDKEGRIELKIDSEFKSILTEVKQRIKYDIENTLNCVSKYSKRLYYHLKLYEDTSWRIDIVEDLCLKLKCPPSYVKNYGKFKEKVLNVAINEINGITDIEFDMEEIREGRKVTRIKFNIKQKRTSNNIIIGTQTNTQINHPVMSAEIVEILGGRVSGDEMFKVENIIDNCFENKTKSKATDKWGYLKEKVEYVDFYIKNNKEGSSYIALLLTALKKDWVGTTPNKKKTKPTDNKGEHKQLKFNNFDNRNYDFDALEEMALGHVEYDASKLIK